MSARAKARHHLPLLELIVALVFIDTVYLYGMRSIVSD